MAYDGPISTSREVGLALLRALGISPRSVNRVELDLSGDVACVRVSVVCRSSMTEQLIAEVRKYELREPSEQLGRAAASGEGGGGAGHAASLDAAQPNRATNQGAGEQF